MPNKPTANRVLEKKAARWALNEYKKQLAATIDIQPRLSTWAVVLLLAALHAPRVVAHNQLPTGGNASGNTTDLARNNSTSIPNAEIVPQAHHVETQMKFSVVEDAANKAKPLPKNKRKKTRADYVKEKLAQGVDKQFIASKITCADMKVKTMLVQVIEEIRALSLEEQKNLDFVLKHPTFGITVENLPDGHHAVYDSRFNVIKFSPKYLSDRKRVVELFLHESRHAHSVLMNLNYADTSGLEFKVVDESMYPYYISCDEQANQNNKKLLRKAIEEGDQQILQGSKEVSGLVKEMPYDDLLNVYTKTKNRHEGLERTYKAQNYDHDPDIEHHAMIHENPQKVKNSVYKGIKLFDREQEKQFEKRLETLPYEGEDVIREEINCRQKRK